MRDFPFMHAVGAILITSLAWMVGPVHAASFDCSKASTLIENAICTNPELSRQDELLARAYQAALKQDPSVKADQIAWLKERNRCIDERCLIRAYDRRIAELSARSTPTGSAAPSGPATQAPSRYKSPAQVADTLQMAGVSRCISAVVVMSAGLAQDPKIKADGPEIRNNNGLLGLYGEARKHLIRSMNNPAAEGAIDNMVRQQGEYYGKIVRFQGWDAFLPTYKECASSAYR
jgi:uncharacterized protein